MGIQFAHIQTFSRKPNKAGQSVNQVLGELTREAIYSAHVPEPAPPQVIDGISPRQLRNAHDAMIKAAQTQVCIDGKLRHRAIRTDRHTLATAVVSYPVPVAEVTGNPEREAVLNAWEEANVKFFQNFFGQHYRATYRHTDETYPHLHIFALPVGLEGIDAQLLHPGKAAKKTTETHCKANGIAPREAVAIGNRALKSAMREWQDLYYREVGEPCGLLRTGPRRERLSRAQYKAREAEAQRRSTSTLAMRQALLDQAGMEMREQIAALQAEKDALYERERIIGAREAAHKHWDEQLQVAVLLLRQAGDRMHRIIGGLAAFLGLEATSRLEDDLSMIEEAAQRIDTHPYAPDQEGLETHAATGA